ncbi:hypothetical protein GQ37_022780 [Janthinobacterium sp. BJB1]|nr:hypothetical protein GQ37_022780 [Janthinobacterium sp. BJB1]
MEKKPEKNDPKVAETGHNAPTLTASNNTVNASIGTSVAEGVSKSRTGIIGEHITDYFLYEKYGWGKDWSRHDMGMQGEWKEKPSKTFPGKLNEATRLNPLFALKAHGTGIDGVWKVQLGDAEQPLVQMSQEWISKNIRIAVKDEAIALDIISKRTKVYSRHLFYTPFYLPSAAAHEKALLEDEREKHEKHADHDIPSTHRHDEQEVRAAVNHKHTKLGLALEP